MPDSLVYLSKIYSSGYRVFLAGKFGPKRMLRKKKKKNEHGLNIWNAPATELIILHTLLNMQEEVNPVQD